MVEKIHRILTALEAFNQRKKGALLSIEELSIIENNIPYIHQQEKEIDTLISLVTKQDKSNEDEIVLLLKKLHKIYVDYRWNIGEIDDPLFKIVLPYIQDEDLSHENPKKHKDNHD